jgi:hypothetical protein
MDLPVNSPRYNRGIIQARMAYLLIAPGETGGNE